MAARNRFRLPLVVALLVLFLMPVSLLAAQATPVASPVAATPASSAASLANVVDLDVLFIGAHPDDEAFGLSTYGQWNEVAGITTGVITVTRGEGGGNAVGPEEGPALGLLREREERAAVAGAAIENIYNLDRVDFYYTVSAPLTEEIWDAEATLEQVVRVVRATRPEVITTMNPAPTPGNHGHHQVAARLAVEAFAAAADPTRFPQQIEEEGLPPWRVKRLFRGGFAGEAPDGPLCASAFVPSDPSDVVSGIWSGAISAGNDDRTWAAVERDSQRLYASQGWAVFPDLDTDPTALACDYFTLAEGRVPFTLTNDSPMAMLEGALAPAAGGLPLGTELFLSLDRVDLVPGQSVIVTAHARSGEGTLDDAVVQLIAPAGWLVEGDGAIGSIGPDEEATTEFTVTAAPNAPVDTRVRLIATLAAGGMQGSTVEALRIVPRVRGTLEPLSQVAHFREWVERTGVPQLDSLIAPVLSLGLGETRELRVDLQNNSDAPQTGEVSLILPEGFSSDSDTLLFESIPPGETDAVTFQVTNTDTALATANEGGDYPLTIITSSGASVGSQQAALNLVPTTTVPMAETAPVVDGIEEADEYVGAELDLSRLWEGDDPESAEDASGTAKVTWSDDALYVLVNVVDDTLGTVMPESDARRHWRTDSVEIAIDPRGTAENTSTTFKIGAFPTTTEGNAAASRDADARQGPVADTAPGLEVASSLTDPYAGYTLEVKIPLAELPAAIDPERMTLNIFIYDSDTEDKTGQTRLGWSTWNGVQGDPYRWGRAILDGYTPPADRSETPGAAELPLEPTRSVSSPQSILQSARDGVGLAGEPVAPAERAVSIASDPVIEGETVLVDLAAAGAGIAHVMLWDGVAATEEQVVELAAGETVTVEVPLLAASADATERLLLVGFEAEEGGTTSLAVPITE